MSDDSRVILVFSYLFILKEKRYVMALSTEIYRVIINDWPEKGLLHLPPMSRDI